MPGSSTIFGFLVTFIILGVLGTYLADNLLTTMDTTAATSPAWANLTVNDPQTAAMTNILNLAVPIGKVMAIVGVLGIVLYFILFTINRTPPMRSIPVSPRVAEGMAASQQAVEAHAAQEDTSGSTSETKEEKKPEKRDRYEVIKV